MRRAQPCTKTIDLRGRTAVPGLIDNHNHIVLLGIRPGHDTRLETAASIADVQAAIEARAKVVPAGEFITAMGGWNPVQFAEKRLPTLAELDAAAPDHPVIVFQAFTGPAAANTRAKAFFTVKGVAVSDTGVIARERAFGRGAERAARDPDVRRSEARNARCAGVRGQRRVDHQRRHGGVPAPGCPDIQDSFTVDTLATADPFRMYDAFTALHRENKLSTRLRLFFLSMDTQPGRPDAEAAPANNIFTGLGDDMLRVSGIGEFATSWPLFGQPAPTNYDTALAVRSRSRDGRSSSTVCRPPRTSSPSTHSKK